MKASAGTWCVLVLVLVLVLYDKCSIFADVYNSPGITAVRILRTTYKRRPWQEDQRADGNSCSSKASTIDSNKR